MGLIRDIARRLWGDNPEPIPQIIKSRQDNARTTRQGQDNGVRLVPVAGQLFANNHDKGQDIEFTLSYTRADNANAYGQRQDNLTQHDLDELESRGLASNLEKAAELKALWASGMSTTDMVRFFHGRYGYGERTMKSYVAAFNAALPGGGVSTE